MFRVFDSIALRGHRLPLAATVVALSAAACCVSHVALAAQPPSKPSAVAAAEGLLHRLLPRHVDRFRFETLPPAEGRDVFELESVGGKIVVRGSTGVAMASGLNWYLNYYCKCHVSWCGDQLKMPERLPPVSGKVRRPSPFQYRYCFNFCAFSYTLAWWDWPQWERMIDWMALHGINMPLAVTGQEAVWRNVLRGYGLSDREIGEFLVGPGFLPFGWMGCIDGWAGPLPQEWIDRHAELQKRILARQRELGMTPVLQGFTGHVPKALSRVFPKASLKRLPSWCEFPGTYFLDPMDPLFRKVGKAFVDEQTRQFGTDHLYASDTFIEMSPPSNDPKFLADMGRAVFGAMTDADPQAIWVMQGWLFFNNPTFWKPPQSKALLGSVPNDRMVVLDLYCETAPVWNKTEGFYGKPWVWSIIQSFGAQVSLHAGLPQIHKDLTAAMTGQYRKQLVGLGLLMEGFGYNPVVYDYLTEMAWRDRPPELNPWLDDFVVRRYGKPSKAAREAWALLLESAYSTSGQAGSVLCVRPKLEVAAGVGYSTAKVVQAWAKLLAAADELGADFSQGDTFRYDLVNVARQALANFSPDVYWDVIDAYGGGDRRATAVAAGRFVELVRDVDELLSTRREFLLGRWLGDAKRWASDEPQRRLYEQNARTIITLWGNKDSLLHEYSEREWSGMLRGFYLPRWQMFFERLDAALAAKKPLDAGRLETDLRAWDLGWTNGTEVYPERTQGDSVAAARRLWAKYGKALSSEPQGGNMTTGKPVSCSSSLPGSPANMANDGRSRSTDLYWATDVNLDKDPWWQVDLEKPTKVGHVTTVFYFGDVRHYGFTLEGSLDGKSWTTLADRRDNKRPSTRQGISTSFPPREIRYLRVRVTHNSANTGRHLVEVTAFAE